MKKEIYMRQLSNIARFDVVREDKLLIYHEQNILFFKTRDEGYFLLPTKVGNKKAFYELISKKIVKNPVIELYQRTGFQLSSSEEGIKTIKHYFVTYLEMTPEEQSSIVQLADQFGLDPCMVPFRNVYAVDSADFYDKGVPIAVKEIDRKIYYKGNFYEARKNASLLARK